MTTKTVEPEAMTPAEIRAAMDQLDAELGRLTVRSASIRGELLDAVFAGDAEAVIRLRAELAELPDRNGMAAIRLGRLDVARLQRMVDAGEKTDMLTSYPGQLSHAKARLDSLIDSMVTPEARAQRVADRKAAHEVRLAEAKAELREQTATHLFGTPLRS